jgi:hydrogenase-4 membrane subunit HyfE
MSPLLVALLGVLLIPLFVATWRTSLIGLGCQGVLMALIARQLESTPNTVGEWLTLVDLGVVRGFVAPLALYAMLRARKTPGRNDVIPPNLLSWTLALGMVLMSFSFSELLVADSGEQQTLVAVAATGALLGFLVLATQSDPFSQMIGALRIENSIALLELGGKHYDSPLAIQLGLLAVFVATIAFFRWSLIALSSSHGAEVGRGASVDGPTL